MIILLHFYVQLAHCNCTPPERPLLDVCSCLPVFLLPPHVQLCMLFIYQVCRSKNTAKHSTRLNIRCFSLVWFSQFNCSVLEALGLGPLLTMVTHAIESRDLLWFIDKIGFSPWPQ